jgi:hypothetical protein
MTITAFSFPDDLPYFERPWTLDGVQYIFRLQWNTRQSIWYLTICDATGTAILSSIAMLTNRNLVKQYPTLPLPRGLLFVGDTTGKAETAGLASFSTTHQLLYVSTASQ